MKRLQICRDLLSLGKRGKFCGGSNISSYFLSSTPRWKSQESTLLTIIIYLEYLYYYYYYYALKRIEHLPLVSFYNYSTE